MTEYEKVLIRHIHKMREKNIEIHSYILELEKYNMKILKENREVKQELSLRNELEYKDSLMHDLSRQGSVTPDYK